MRIFRFYAHLAVSIQRFFMQRNPNALTAQWRPTQTNQSSYISTYSKIEQISMVFILKGSDFSYKDI